MCFFHQICIPKISEFPKKLFFTSLRTIQDNVLRTGQDRTGQDRTKKHGVVRTGQDMTRQDSVLRTCMDHLGVHGQEVLCSGADGKAELNHFRLKQDGYRS